MWAIEFGEYFNRGCSSNLYSKGPYIERTMLEQAHFTTRYGQDPLANADNFKLYWSKVQFSLIQQGRSHHEFDELTKLVDSFNEGNNVFYR